MLRLVVCCGGGMSSSVLSKKFQDLIQENHWQDQVSVAYQPFTLLSKQQENYDLALLCPHSVYTAKDLIKKGVITIPVYIIPAQLYGSMKPELLLEDAIDILDIYHDTKMNPLHFPHEDFLERKRNTSHRRWVKLHPYKE